VHHTLTLTSARFHVGVRACSWEADLDVVFPDKKVSMTLLDRTIFMVGVLLGVYLLLSELWQIVTGGEVCDTTRPSPCLALPRLASMSD